jgi:ABC-type transporter Mla MlaB component
VQSSQAEITQQNPQQYLVSGVVDFSTAPDLLRRSLVLFSESMKSENRQLTIDLSSVKECNSAALALILEMAKSARQKNIEAHFENLPASLLTIAKAYGVENEIRELCK